MRKAEDVIRSTPGHPRGGNTVDQQIARVHALHAFTKSHRDIREHVGDVHEKCRDHRDDVGWLGVRRWNRDDNARNNGSALQTICAERHRLQGVAPKRRIPHDAVWTAVSLADDNAVRQEKDVRYSTIERAGICGDKHIGRTFDHGPVGRLGNLRKWRMDFIIESYLHQCGSSDRALVVGGCSFQRVQSERRVYPIKTVRAVWLEHTVANFIIVREKFDLGHGTVGIKCRRLQSNQGWSDQNCVVGRAHQHNVRRLIADHERNSEQTQVKPNVGAISEVLMDFHRKNILPLLEKARRKQARKGGAAIIIGGCRGMRLVGNRAIGHVVAGNFHAVQIDNRTVVALQIHQHRDETGDISGRECLPKISGDEFIRGVRTKRIGGEGLASVGIAVPKRRRAAGPEAVVEVGPDPISSLIAAIIKVLPN